VISSIEATTTMSNDIIYLNVGGIKYSTTRSTLTKYPNSMIGAMFSKLNPAQVDKDGCYFIDRNVPMFEYILQFLRSGELILPDSFKKHKLLKCEVDYYQIVPLVESLKNNKSKFNRNQVMICISFIRLNIDDGIHHSSCSLYQRVNGYSFEQIHEWNRYFYEEQCDYSKKLVQQWLDDDWMLQDEKIILSHDKLATYILATGFDKETLHRLLDRSPLIDNDCQRVEILTYSRH